MLSRDNPPRGLLHFAYIGQVVPVAHSCEAVRKDLACARKALSVVCPVRRTTWQKTKMWTMRLGKTTRRSLWQSRVCLLLSLLLAAAGSAG